MGKSTTTDKRRKQSALQQKRERESDDKESEYCEENLSSVSRNNTRLCLLLCLLLLLPRRKKSDFSITVTPLNSGLTLAAASKLGLYNDTDNNGSEPLSEMSERWTSKRAQKSNNYAF